VAVGERLAVCALEAFFLERGRGQRSEGEVFPGELGFGRRRRADEIVDEGLLAVTAGDEGRQGENREAPPRDRRQLLARDR
jgi:hypothetical protein